MQVKFTDRNLAHRLAMAKQKAAKPSLLKHNNHIKSLEDL